MTSKKRIDLVRGIVNEVLEKQTDKIHANCGYIHLYGVSALCHQLALSRSLDPELAMIIAMLHDIYTYRTKISKLHAHNGAKDALIILKKLNVFTEEEQQIITNAIYHHSSKSEINDSYDELLKDADTLQYYLHNPNRACTLARFNRLNSIFKELGLNTEVLSNCKIV